MVLISVDACRHARVTLRVTLRVTHVVTLRHGRRGDAALGLPVAPPWMRLAIGPRSLGPLLADLFLGQSLLLSARLFISFHHQEAAGAFAPIRDGAVRREELRLDQGRQEFAFCPF